MKSVFDIRCLWLVFYQIDKTGAILMNFNNNYVKEVLFVLHEVDVDTATQPTADFLPDSGELQIQGFSPEHGCGTAFHEAAAIYRRCRPSRRLAPGG